jgi:hypothetical protein
MRIRYSLATVPALFIAMGIVSADPTKPATDELELKLKLIKPTWAESGWSQIPWMLDLTAARKKAAAEGKPLYVWSMSGEPLGQC